MHIIANALAVAAALVAVSPATAHTHANEFDVRKERVPYADLDLASDAGRAKLDRRINAAAVRVCSLRAVDLATQMRERACVATARARTAERVAALTTRGVDLASVGGGASGIVAR